MKVEVEGFDIFDEEDNEYLKVYIKCHPNSSFKKQYEFLKKEFVIRCKIIDGEGFIIIKKEDLEKLKEESKKERIKIIDYDKINSKEIFC
ncbi:MAG: hypothetical protein QXS37_04835 [Candidatus Aenigmatarchaeota archaeon]